MIAGQVAIEQVARACEAAGRTAAMRACAALTVAERISEIQLDPNIAAPDG